MVAAEGILTARGGMTSHAAVVARGMGKCFALRAVPPLLWTKPERLLKAGERAFTEGDYISLNGTTGAVYCGQIETVAPEFSGEFGTVMSWADELQNTENQNQCR